MKVTCPNDKGRLVLSDPQYHRVALRSLVRLKSMLPLSTRGKSCLLTALLLVNSHNPGGNWFLPTSFLETFQ